MEQTKGDNNKPGAPSRGEHEVDEIADMTRVLLLAPESHPDRPVYLGYLGRMHRIRFQRLGKLEDLQKAHEYITSAMPVLGTGGIPSGGHPDFPWIAYELAIVYELRYLRQGDLADLGKAIELFSQAILLTPNPHPALPQRLDDLGIAHDLRFQRLGELDDLEKAIQYKSRAVSLLSSDNPDLATRLESLGRVGSLSKFDELDKAIEYMARAVSLTPEDHVDMSQRVTNLGLIYKSRFEHLKELDDLDQAIKYLSRAVLLRPEGHPNQSENLGALGRAYATQFQESREIKHLHDSLDCFRKAAQYVAGRPSIRFDCARQWAKLAAQHDIPESLEAYQVAIDLIPGLVWLGSTTNQRYERARELSNLAVEAASVAIGINNCALALEWLENARCVIWSQLLLLRYPLDQLRSSQPGLADRIGKVSGALYSAGSGTSLPSDTLEKERVDQQHRRLAVEFDQLISNARMIPGFENFLKPKRASELAHAARKGPVVVINCHEMRSDALIIIPGQTEIAHIPLPQSTYKGAQRSRVQMEASLKSTGIRERGFKNVPSAQRIGGFEDLLSTLWVDIAKPVLDFLGYTPKPNTEEMPHITWCPTSVLSFLPIHAAGKYNQPHSKVSDFAVSSYTPTLTALLSPLHSSTTRPRILVVGQEATPGHNQLPGITKELACIENHARNVAELSQITSSDATAPAVLDAMEQHDWVHLACHAHQNAANPTKSGFFLHESSLDLDSITRRLFTQKGLAFLSACQTATGDEILPDEAVHLASGMLMAGYSSVIATMWSVLDEDAPFITDKVYGQLMKDGRVGNGEGAKALHNAAAELRAKVGDKAFGRWVPYIHMGS
ncbi:unnamed protein product [Rhizoctonia solani]|uniref:CHAT domain-containing protein n=1 Tax=Rhizoctonia solani TaxID=456999 RepID=A0A8H3HR75_9AGAM|nr:unnamed protein product [Rhizoctonia solani]